MQRGKILAQVQLACHVEAPGPLEVSLRFGHCRKPAAKFLRHSVPSGYRRRGPLRRPKLDEKAHIYGMSIVAP